MVSDPAGEDGGQESWGTYQFGLDNAVRYNDLDGRCPDGCPGGSLLDFSAGVVNSVIDNIVGSNLSENYTPGNAADYNAGLDAGNLGSQGVGAYLTVQGFVDLTGSGTLTAASLAVEVGSGGLATPVAGPGLALGLATTAKGGAEVALGYRLLNNGAKNFANQNGRVNANSSTKTNSNSTSGNNSAAQKGKQAHRDFAKKVESKPGWKSEVTLKGKNGKTYRADAMTPSGNLVELKPNTPRGRSRGKSQAKTCEQQTGCKTRVVYY